MVVCSEVKDLSPLSRVHDLFSSILQKGSSIAVESRRGFFRYRSIKKVGVFVWSEIQNIQVPKFMYIRQEMIYTIDFGSEKSMIGCTFKYSIGMIIKILNALYKFMVTYS